MAKTDLEPYPRRSHIVVLRRIWSVNALVVAAPPARTLTIQDRHSFPLRRRHIIRLHVFHIQHRSWVCSSHVVGPLSRAHHSVGIDATRVVIDVKAPSDPRAIFAMPGRLRTLCHCQQSGTELDDRSARDSSADDLPHSSCGSRESHETISTMSSPRVLLSTMIMSVTAPFVSHSNGSPPALEIRVSCYR